MTGFYKLSKTWRYSKLLRNVSQRERRGLRGPVLPRIEATKLTSLFSRFRQKVSARSPSSGWCCIGRQSKADRPHQEMSKYGSKWSRKQHSDTTITPEVSR